MIISLVFIGLLPSHLHPSHLRSEGCAISPLPLATPSLACPSSAMFVCLSCPPEPAQPLSDRSLIRDLDIRSTSEPTCLSACFIRLNIRIMVPAFKPRSPRAEAPGLALGISVTGLCLSQVEEEAGGDPSLPGLPAISAHPHEGRDGLRRLRGGRKASSRRREGVEDVGRPRDSGPDEAPGSERNLLQRLRLRLHPGVKRVFA